MAICAAQYGNQNAGFQRRNLPGIQSIGRKAPEAWQSLYQAGDMGMAQAKTGNSTESDGRSA
jgi:hypothetical protein